MRLPRGRQGLIVLAGVLLLAWVARECAAPAADAGEAAIVAAFESRRSGVMVESVGTVERLLADDLEGSPHQRIIVRLGGGHSLLLVHNIDLAERVPAEVGDRIAFRGQYEWNDRGGLVHWTHDDPRGRRPGGWLRHEERTYR